MQLELIPQCKPPIVAATSDQPVITDASVALDLIMTSQYQWDADRIALSQAALSPDFFILSTGLAGEVLQKFINYHAKLAIYGDFSGYTSKPLRDFIYECNQGEDIFFTGSKQEAIERLRNAR